MVHGDAVVGECGFVVGPSMFRRTRYAAEETCRMMKVAVVGGGLAGLSVCDRLLAAGVDEVRMYDPNPIAKGNASAAAAGMLHKFNPRGRKAYLADKAFKRSEEVICSCAPDAVISRGPIVRLAMSEKQLHDYRVAVDKAPSELVLVGGEQLKSYVAKAPAEHGLVILDALVIDTKTYMQGLWTKCSQQGRILHNQERVDSPSLLLKEGFDHVVIAAGYQSGDLVPGGLAMNRKQGRNLLFKRKESAESLEVPLISGKYLVPIRDESLLAGATIEPEFDDPSQSPSIEDTLEALGNRVLELYPSLPNDYEPTSVTMGVRGIPKRPPGVAPVPFLAQPIPNLWIFTGLASRGLLHHALLADMLADAIIANDPSQLPSVLHTDNI